MSEQGKLSPAALLRVWTLGHLVIEYRADTDAAWHPIASSAWKGSSHPRSLLKLLLCCPQRRAQRSFLVETLWPELDVEAGYTYLSNAAYKLRSVFPQHAALLTTFGDHRDSGYQLADQSLLWVDADACETLLAETERVGRLSVEAVSLLEDALHYFERGSFLHTEEGLWCYSRRARLEQLSSRCRIWLAEAYEQQGHVGPAEQQYQTLLEEDPTNEDALRRLMRLHHQQGMTYLARRCYEETKRQAREAGQKLSPTMHTFAQRLLNEPHHDEVFLGERKPQTLARSSEDDGRQVILPPLSHVQDSKKGAEDMIDATVSDTMNNIYSANIGLFAISQNTLALPLWERLSRTLEKSSSIDETALIGLEQITVSYWQLRITTGYQNLLHGFLGHLETITQLLRTSQSLSVRKRLCSIAGQTAQYIGAICFDMNDYITARAFYNVSLEVAQEAENALLLAIGLGRMSSLPIYSNHPQEALPLLQEARRLATKYGSASILAWLASVEAEANANLCDTHASFQSLEQAETMIGREDHKEVPYEITFNYAKFVGYKGVCFLRLHHTNAAIATLHDGLHLIEMLSPRQRAIMVADIAEAYRQQGQIEEACNQAIQALEMIDYTKSHLVLQRLRKLRSDMKSWEALRFVKELDEQIALRTR